MRFSSDDEHVSLYGTPVHQNGSQVLLKTFTGIYGFVDEDGQELVRRNPPGAMPYPCLSIKKIIKAFTDEQWNIESLRISHVQLVGNRLDFVKLASCIASCHTLKTVMLGDSRTSFLRGDEDESMMHSGFDAVMAALSRSACLQEVSLQNMEEISSEALGDLCASTSLEKLQLLMSQSFLPTGGISGDYIRSMAQRLRSNQTLKELRIFGVLEQEACHYVSQMLLENRSLQKIALKIKLKPNRNTAMPLFRALASPSCCLTSMEFYLSGSRQDLEACSDSFRDALKANQSIKQLNVIFYGLDIHSRGGGLAAIRTNMLWMERLEEAMEHNYVLQQVMINHGLLELSDKVKLYLRLNRAGRGVLLNHSEDGRSTELSSWVETLSRVKNDTSSLFYLVSCAPTLLCGPRLLNEDCGNLPLKRKR